MKYAKPAKPGIQVMFRLASEKKAALEQRCTLLGITQQQLIENAVDLRLGFPESAMEEMEKVATETGLGVNFIIIAMITKLVAFEHAWMEVFGKASPGTGRELQFDGRRLIIGDELLQKLHDHYVELLESAKAKLGPEIPPAGVLVPTSQIEGILRGL